MPLTAGPSSSSLPLSLQPCSAGPSFGPRIHRPSSPSSSSSSSHGHGVSSADLLSTASLSAIHRSVSSTLADSDLRQKDLDTLARLIDGTGQLIHLTSATNDSHDGINTHSNATTASGRNGKPNSSGDLRKKRSNNALSGGLTSATGEGRGTKRARLDSDSSLSPAASSTSSLETTISSHITTTSNGKPATQSALQSVKAEEQRITLSRANSEDSVVKSSASKATTHADSLKASTSQGGIPGISAPVPALPGFTKKKKQQPKDSPVTSRSSPQPNEALSKSTSVSSLPPRPASLPPKPLTIVPPLLINDHDASHAGPPSTTLADKDSRSPLSKTLHPGSAESRERDALQLQQQQSQRSKSSRAASPLAAEIVPSSDATEVDDAVRLALDGTRTKPRASSKDDVVMQVDDDDSAVSTKPAATSSTSTHAPVARKAIAQSAAAHLLSSPNSSTRHQSLPSPRLAAGKLPSRPGTPQARKNLPASVVSASLGRPITNVDMELDVKGSDNAAASNGMHADHAGSHQAISANGSPASLKTAPQSASQQPQRSAGLGQKGIFASTQGMAASAIAEQEAKAAKAKRKEEKRKRKLAAAAAAGGDTTTSGAKMSRDSSNVCAATTQKIRSTQSPAPNHLEQTQAPQAGLKVRLNGVMLNSKNLLSGLGIDGTAPKRVVQIPGVAEDFSLPKRNGVPAPPELKIPEATPMLQSEVNADFDQVKPATQVPYTTYSNWMNDFLRPFGEDDLAYLSTRKDDSSFYVVPHLGSHYQEQWAAADADTSLDNIEMPAANTSLRPPAPKRFKADQLSNEVLNTENVYLGPLGERVMSAFRPTNGYSSMLNEIRLHSTGNAVAVTTGDAKQLAITAAETSPQFADLNSFLAQPQITRSDPDADAVDFESRLTQELAFLGIIPLPVAGAPTAATNAAGTKGSSSSANDIPQSVDWTTREDDEISHALRACQRLLREQTNLNKARKDRLAERVRGRIAYQEYETLRDGLEAVIEGAWHKRQRAAQRRAHKEKKDKDKKDRDRDREAEATATLAQQIEALNQPQPLSASLVTALTKRRNLVDGISSLFPKDAYVLPAETVYADIKRPKAISLA